MASKTFFAVALLVLLAAAAVQATQIAQDDIAHEMSGAGRGLNFFFGHLKHYSYGHKYHYKFEHKPYYKYKVYGGRRYYDYDYCHKKSYACFDHKYEKCECDSKYSKYKKYDCDH